MAIVIPTIAFSTYYDDGTSVVLDHFCRTCEAGCPVAWSPSGANPTATGNYLAYQQLVRGLCFAASHNVSFSWDSFAVIPNQFVVSCDGSNIYDTGCVTGSGSTTLTIPAGTKEFNVFVYGACGPAGGDLWSYTVGC